MNYAYEIDYEIKERNTPFKVVEIADCFDTADAQARIKIKNKWKTANNGVIDINKDMDIISSRRITNQV